MGFETTDKTRRTFVSIIGGKFAIRADENTPNARKRHSEKLGKDVWEVVHETFTGRIKSLEIRSSEFGDQLSILMDDVGDLYEFQIPTESRYFTSFCDRIENVNINDDVKLAPYSFDDKEKKNSHGNPKKVTGINIFQNGKKIEKFYSKDNNGNKPTLKEGYKDADLKIFFIQQQEFFKELIPTINANLPDSNLVRSEMGDQSRNEPIENEADDDLPF